MDDGGTAMRPNMVEEMLVVAWVRQAFTEGWLAGVQEREEGDAWDESAARINLEGENDEQ
jgi:hypothetical protein